jgi:MraZ protein
MLLTGTYARVIDEKKRVAIPKPIREQFGRPAPKKLFITPGSSGSLWIFTPEMLERFGERLLAERHNDRELAVYRRLYFARAEPTDIDQQGRILISDRLAQYAGLGRDVVIIGVLDHLELWDKRSWIGYEKTHASQFGNRAERTLHG